MAFQRAYVTWFLMNSLSDSHSVAHSLVYLLLFCAIKSCLMCSCSHIPALLAREEFNILDTEKFIWQINNGSLWCDSVTNASVTAMGALITVLANEPIPVRCLIVYKRCSVPPFAVLKMKRINSFSLKGGTGTDLPLDKLLGTSVRVCPDTIP